MSTPNPLISPSRLRKVLVVGVLPAVLLSIAAGRISAQTTSSTPIALSSDNKQLWVVNPDNNSVSLINVEADANAKVIEVAVGLEPRRLALLPGNAKLYVANMAGASVSVIDTATRTVLRTISVGAEPLGLAVTADGTRIYVANHSSDNVSVIDTALDKVIKTIVGVGPKPSGVAIDGNKVYVTQFLAQLRAGGNEGADDGKEGRVTVISRLSNTVIGTVVLNPLANTGFNAAGDALARIPPGATFIFPTGCFPNLLESIVVRNGKAYLPNVGSSPNGPVRFNVNVQSLLSVFDTATDTEFGSALNMNVGVPFEVVGKRIFNTTPIAAAFKNASAEGFVVCAGIDRLLRVTLNGAGAPSHNPPIAPLAAADPDPIIRVPVGKNPQGIAINSTDTRAYVFNYISRDVSVVDIQAGSATQFTELVRVSSAALPAAATLAALIQRGKELFNSSIGPSGTTDNALAPAGRLSDFGWGNCYNCHPRGRQDGVTWIFGDGPRQTISMESTGEHPQPAGSTVNSCGGPLLPGFRQRVLNWSATRDEIQDFELNIRNVSGGQGLITDGAAVFNLTPTANTGRSCDLDAIAAYVAMGIRAPISPTFNSVLTTAQGRALFTAANCQMCHGGPNWTRSQVNFTPPPDLAGINLGQLVGFLRNVGTFDSLAFNEVTANGGTPLGADGFNIPSLIGVFASAPYLHNGAAPTLDDVLNNVTHRSAGTGGVDTLANAADRAAIVRFLKSIDARTTSFP
jgi:YVTN family beta-propeller protein